MTPTITPLDVLAIAAHPDDAELGCGGTLAKLARLGRNVGILDLTRGELGTRGTVAGRAREAADAAAILGLTTRVNAGLPDGGLDPFSAEQRLVVIRLLRELRPRLLLTPWIEVRHPDHRHATELVEEAAFRAGLHAIDSGGGEPFRPRGILYYMERPAFVPSLIVDVSRDYDTKRAAIRAHVSQFGNAASAEPVTFISRPEFLEGLEARDRHYGDLVGATYGEPFLSRAPLPVADPSALWQSEEGTK